MKEEYIRRVKGHLPLPRQQKREVLQDLEEIFASAGSMGRAKPRCWTGWAARRSTPKRCWPRSAMRPGQGKLPGAGPLRPGVRGVSGPVPLEPERPPAGGRHRRGGEQHEYPGGGRCGPLPSAAGSGGCGAGGGGVLCFLAASKKKGVTDEKETGSRMPFGSASGVLCAGCGNRPFPGGSHLDHDRGVRQRRPGGGLRPGAAQNHPGVEEFSLTCTAKDGMVTFQTEEDTRQGTYRQTQREGYGSSTRWRSRTGAGDTPSAPGRNRTPGSAALPWC